MKRAVAIVVSAAAIAIATLPPAHGDVIVESKDFELVTNVPIGGIAVNSLGHAHPALVSAVTPEALPTSFKVKYSPESGVSRITVSPAPWARGRRRLSRRGSPTPARAGCSRP